MALHLYVFHLIKDELRAGIAIFAQGFEYFTRYDANHFSGKTRARDAALNAIQSPLLDIGIERATGIVWNITGGSDLTLYEVAFLFSLFLYLVILQFI